MTTNQPGPEDPTQAGAPRTKGPTRVYENDEIRVLWDATRCTHVAHCMLAQPEVFDALRRPWVDIDAADPQSIAEAVLRCPTGALRYESKGDLPQESPPPHTEVEMRPNGPLYIRGTLRVKGPKGEVVTEEYRLALCRCGASNNKPFCDNSHFVAGFRD